MEASPPPYDPAASPLPMVEAAPSQLAGALKVFDEMLPKVWNAVGGAPCQHISADIQPKLVWKPPAVSLNIFCQHKLTIKKYQGSGDKSIRGNLTCSKGHEWHTTRKKCITSYRWALLATEQHPLLPWPRFIWRRLERKSCLHLSRLRKDQYNRQN
jgi:hypothetical protein